MNSKPRMPTSSKGTPGTGIQPSLSAAYGAIQLRPLPLCGLPLSQSSVRLVHLSLPKVDPDTCQTKTRNTMGAACICTCYRSITMRLVHHRSHCTHSGCIFSKRTDVPGWSLSEVLDKYLATVRSTSRKVSSSTSSGSRKRGFLASKVRRWWLIP